MGGKSQTLLHAAIGDVWIHGVVGSQEQVVLVEDVG